MNERSESNKLWLGALIVLMLATAAHLRGLRGQFVEWDDSTHITRNALIRTLTFENVRLMFTKPIAKLYCPLTSLSYAIDYQLWGHDPFGYHLTNLLLHLANTVLVLILVRKILYNRYEPATMTAILAAAIFGVHPLRVESVAWVTERKDVLFAFFYFCALLVYWRWLEAHKPRDYWACFGLFVAAALSKATAVTFPAVLLLIDHFVAKRKAREEKIPFFIVSLIIMAVTFVSQASGRGDTVVSPEVIPIWARIGLVGYCSLFYIGKFLWPFHLSAIYPPFDEMHWTVLMSLGYAAAFALITVLAVVVRRRWPALLPAWAFYVIALSPTIGLAPVGIHVVADRFSYVALIGLALPVSMAVASATTSAPNTATRLALGGVIVVTFATLAFWTDQRSAVWSNTETLFLNALQENPNCLPAHINLTFWYTRLRRFDEAIEHGQRAVEIAPYGIPGRKNLAYAYINDGRRREAIGVLRPLAQQSVEDPDVWRILAECFEALGDTNNAKLARQSQRSCEGKL
jgi:hypothetical protein